MIKDKNTDKLISIFDRYMSSADLLKAELQAKISSAIVKKRIEMDMSQKEFAKYLGVSQGLISRWEGSDHNFTINTIAEVFDKLDIKFNLLIENEIEQKSFAEIRNENSIGFDYRDDIFADYSIKYSSSKEYKNENWTTIANSLRVKEKVVINASTN